MNLNNSDNSNNLNNLNNSNKMKRNSNQQNQTQQKEIEQIEINDESEFDWLSAMLDKALDAEEKAYQKVISASYGWEPKAMATRLIERAIEYQNTPEVQHSSNQWVNRDNTHKDISNKVYHMHIFYHEYSSWRTTSKRWETKWYLSKI